MDSPSDCLIASGDTFELDAIPSGEITLFDIQALIESMSSESFDIPVGSSGEGAGIPLVGSGGEGVGIFEDIPEEVVEVAEEVVDEVAEEYESFLGPRPFSFTDIPSGSGSGFFSSSESENDDELYDILSHPPSDDEAGALNEQGNPLLFFSSDLIFLPEWKRLLHQNENAALLRRKLELEEQILAHREPKTSWWARINGAVFPISVKLLRVLIFGLCFAMVAPVVAAVWVDQTLLHKIMEDWMGQGFADAYSPIHSKLVQIVRLTDDNEFVPIFRYEPPRKIVNSFDEIFSSVWKVFHYWN